MTRLLALLLQESLHKRIALVTSRRVIPLADWARAAGVRGTVAANKAKRQTIRLPVARPLDDRRRLSSRGYFVTLSVTVVFFAATWEVPA